MTWRSGIRSSWTSNGSCIFRVAPHQFVPARWYPRHHRKQHVVILYSSRTAFPINLPGICRDLEKVREKGVVSNKQGGMIDIFRQQTTLDHGVGFADTTSKLSDFDKSGHIGSLCSSPGRASSKDGQITTQHAASTIGRRGSAR